MDTEKSQFSKQSTSIIPQGQCPANGVCVPKFVQSLWVFASFAVLCSPPLLLICLSSLSEATCS